MRMVNILLDGEVCLWFGIGKKKRVRFNYSTLQCNQNLPTLINYNFFTSFKASLLFQSKLKVTKNSLI